MDVTITLSFSDAVSLHTACFFLKDREMIGESMRRVGDAVWDQIGPIITEHHNTPTDRPEPGEDE